MPPSLLLASDLEYVGRTFFPSNPVMTFAYGAGLRSVGSVLKFYSLHHTSRKIWQYDVPSTYSGYLTNPVDVGTMVILSPTDIIGGLFWDEPGQRMYISFGGVYSTALTRQTLSSSTFASTGKLANYSWNQSFGDHWKKTIGGVTAIPDWFSSAYLGGRRLGVGFGGAPDAIVTRSSLGPALRAIDPTPAGGNQIIPSTVLQAYHYDSGGPAPIVSFRPTNYMQEPPGSIGQFDPRYPYDPTILGVGYWTWTDRICGSGAWVEAEGKSGFVTFANLGVDCLWYGHNDGTVNPCSGSLGTKAALNAQRNGIYCYITDPADLALVVGGANPNSIQSTYTKFDLLGINNPKAPGLPSTTYNVIAASWIGAPYNRLALLIHDFGSGHLSVLYWFKVRSGTTPPPPDPIPAPIIVYPLNNATGIPI